MGGDSEGASRYEDALVSAIDGLRFNDRSERTDCVARVELISLLHSCVSPNAPLPDFIQTRYFER
jgi:hypothetical protein